MYRTQTHNTRLKVTPVKLALLLYRLTPPPAERCAGAVGVVLPSDTP